MLDDSALLQRFAAARAEEDFAELVRRHLNLVYSAALRQVGGDHQFAEEVTQSVFTDLARKAGSLTNHISLAGWLYTSAHYAAAKIVRGEQRRRLREQEAHQMHETHANATPELDWEQLQPVIDGAMHELPEPDREVILQRYFERKPFLQIGVRLGLTENAARMRAERALDKLRGILATRGVSSTTMALAAVLTAQAVLAAPAALTGAVVTTSLTAAAATGAVAGGGLLAAAKLKVLIPSACAVALLGGVILQQQALNQLREENTALRMQVVAIKDAPAMVVKPEDGMAKSQRENMELLRLRGEVGRIRRELAEQKTLVAQLVQTNNVTAQAQQKMEPQINLRARFYTGADEALEFFKDNTTAVVVPAEMNKLLNHLKESDNAELLAVQQVTTLSGRQAQMRSSESKTNISTGAVTESVLLTDVLPTLQADGYSVALNLTVAGYDDYPGGAALAESDAKGNPLPLIRERKMTTTTMTWDGQTVAMALRTDDRRIVVFVTPTLIDPAGDRVHPATEY